MRMVLRALRARAGYCKGQGYCGAYSFVLERADISLRSRTHPLALGGHLSQVEKETRDLHGINVYLVVALSEFGRRGHGNRNCQRGRINQFSGMKKKEMGGMSSDLSLSDAANHGCEKDRFLQWFRRRSGTRGFGGTPTFLDDQKCRSSHHFCVRKT